MKKIMAILAAASVLAVGVFTGCKAEEGDTIYEKGTNTFIGTVTGNATSKIGTGTETKTDFASNNATWSWETVRSGNYTQFALTPTGTAKATTDTGAAGSGITSSGKFDTVLVPQKIGDKYYVRYEVDEWDAGITTPAKHTVAKFAEVKVTAGSLTSGNFTYTYNITAKSATSANTTVDVVYTGTVTFAKVDSL